MENSNFPEVNQITSLTSGCFTLFAFCIDIMIQFYEGTAKKSVTKNNEFLCGFILCLFFEQEKLFFVWINSHFVEESTMMKKKQVRYKKVIKISITFFLRVE